MYAEDRVNAPRAKERVTGDSVLIARERGIVRSARGRENGKLKMPDRRTGAGGVLTHRNRRSKGALLSYRIVMLS